MRRLAVFILLTIACAAARADTPSQADTQAAKIHYQAGEQYYVRGNYPEAISEFKEAYRLSQASALLYNMSQAYDRLGDLPHAREYLAKYLATGQADPSEVPSLREKLALLDKRIAEEKPPVSDEAKPPPEAVAPPPPPPLVTTLPPTPAEVSRPWKTWKWVVGGTGAACLVLAILFAADENNMAKKLEDAANSTDKQMYALDLKDDYARGQRDQNLAIGFGIAGGVLAATGVVLFVLDSRSGSEKPPQTVITPILAPRTAGASAVWRF